MAVSLAVLTQYTNVTPSQTDRQTPNDSKAKAALVYAIIHHRSPINDYDFSSPLITCPGGWVMFSSALCLDLWVCPSVLKIV